PAAILRKKFGFERLPDFDAAVWEQVRKKAMSQIKSVHRGIIAGSDKSAQAVQAALRNCEMLDKSHVIQISQRDVFEIENLEGHTIVCNPPYGIRLGKGRDLSALYKNLGDFLKQKCRGTNVFIYFGEPEYIKSVGLKPCWKQPLSNGGLDGRLVKFEVYRG
ncbi:MAG: class I SAM-dependent RNA methyltransferase, partial [bacterium]